MRILGQMKTCFHVRSSIGLLILNNSTGRPNYERILIKTIEELPPILRTVFVLQDLEGLSTDQTADALNLSQSAVKSRLWRARLQLRERLNKYFARVYQISTKS
jgi:DNA-directed RNA polymerase specialized sigma24 family protein